MVTTEIIRVFGSPGRGEELEIVLSQAANHFTDDPECKGVKFFRGVEDPNGFYFLIEWSSIEAHKSWRKTDHRTQFLDAIAPFKERPNEFAHFSVFISR